MKSKVKSLKIIENSMGFVTVMVGKNIKVCKNFSYEVKENINYLYDNGGKNLGNCLWKEEMERITDEAIKEAMILREVKYVWTL